jgi:hypothetical protein
MFSPGSPPPAALSRLPLPPSSTAAISAPYPASPPLPQRQAHPLPPRRSPQANRTCPRLRRTRGPRLHRPRAR